MLDNKNIANLAKLTPPRADKVYNRKRLFKQLNDVQNKSVIWVSAPAGSGKTTLISSYLKEKSISPLWFQIDEGDADIASFFYYLGKLGKQATPYNKNLPLLTPEYMLGLPTFTRNFFRELFASIKTEAQDLYEASEHNSARIQVGLSLSLYLMSENNFKAKEMLDALNVIANTNTCY